MSYQTEQILGWCWFSDRKGTIGIVCCQSHKEKRYSLKGYIATVTGASKGIDALYVANCGAKFPASDAISLIKKTGEINQVHFHDKTLLTEIFIEDGDKETKH
jgi:hypothetical protein